MYDCVYVCMYDIVCVLLYHDMPSMYGGQEGQIPHPPQINPN
jgi:hypothetical protein